MIALYYVGGPLDLHKAALPHKPRVDTLTVQIASPLPFDDSVSNNVKNEVEKHTYRIRQLAREVFVAVYEELL